MTNKSSVARDDARADIHRRFFDIEKNLDLFDWRVNGVPLWERLRISVYDSVLQSTGVHGTRHNTADKSTANMLKGTYLWMRNIVFNNPLIGDEHDILVWGHQRRRQLSDGCWWDIYTDPLFDGVDLDYQQIETASRLTHYRPAKTTNIDYLDLITYSSTIYRELDRSKTRLNSQTVRDIETRIADEFGVEVDVGRLAYEELTDRQIYLPLYRQVLRRVDPDVVFVVVGASKETFIEACEHHGVTVVELQHGFVGDYHIGYDFPQGENKVYKPDYFFSFGPYWTDAVPMFKNEDVFDVGYQYIEREYRKYSNVSGTNELLFISQGAHGQRLSRIAGELATLGLDEYDIVYKLHPDEFDHWEEDYPWLVNSDIRVLKDDVDLYELQARARAQFGVNSTALFEGIRFGAPTVLFETDGICAMNRFIMEYDIPIVSDAKELLEVVPTLDEQQVDPRMFFTENPSEKFEEAIEVIRSK